MAVMTMAPKKPETKPPKMETKKQLRSLDKMRPITATLDHPLILDIKLLKKLDMSTFTKKGLIALSKLCGISLVKKTDSKRKFNKTIKAIQHSKKQSTNENSGIFAKEPDAESNKKDHFKPKRKPLKQISKLKPRINFKRVEETNWLEEDSSDVICKKQDKITKKNKTSLKWIKESHGTNKKSIMEDVFNGNVIAEPCKSCSRSEQPERLHSHPKILIKLSENMSNRILGMKNAERLGLEERFKNSVSTKELNEESGKERKSPCAKDSDDSTVGSPLKSLSSSDEHNRSLPSCRYLKIRTNAVSPTKSVSSCDLDISEPRTNRKIKINKISTNNSPSKSTNEVQYPKKITAKNSTNSAEEEKSSLSPVDDAMSFITGCYICGKQMSPKMRIKHERECISEWRAQISLLSPEKRKLEPKRPDYRFTASGEVDCEGTFESIWANHKDSLIPCKKCGRKFFPDRIEKHETCCNKMPIRVKYKY